MLGEVTVDTVGGAVLRPRDRLVLGALSVRAGRPLSPEEIADAVWAGAPPVSWPKQVQICVARLRKSLPSGAIETTADGGYRLVPTLVELDVVDLEHLLGRGRHFAATDEPDRAATAFTRALSLVRGPPYRALDHWPPASSEAARLADVISSAREDLVEARLAVGEHREVAPVAEALVAEDPLRERRWAALVLAQYRCGRQADALRSLRQARAALRENLGIDPGPELVELERRVLGRDEALRGRPAQPAAATACPYKGLAALDAGDPIFGRDEEIATCLDRVGDRGLLVITGPSGSGKSSLVRAGIVPSLLARGRRCDVLVPAQAAGLALPEGADVVVVDQFEELFASQVDPAVVARSCASVAEHARSRGFVIMTVRADHLARLSGEPGLARLAEQNLHLLAAPTGEALREAVDDRPWRRGCGSRPAWSTWSSVTPRASRGRSR